MKVLSVEDVEELQVGVQGDTLQRFITVFTDNLVGSVTVVRNKKTLVVNHFWNDIFDWVLVGNVDVWL